MDQARLDAAKLQAESFAKLAKAMERIAKVLEQHAKSETNEQTEHKD